MRDLPLRERVYQQLRSALMSGEIAPGETLSEVRLAKKYDVSRTPVREALARLLADGLIVRDEETSRLVPFRLRFDQLMDYYELRILVETAGLKRLASSPKLPARESLVAERALWAGSSNEEPDTGFVARDEGLHNTLLAAAGSFALSETLSSVHLKIRAVRMFDYLTEDRVATTVREHVEILDAVFAGDFDQAQAVLNTHIETSRDIVLERARAAIEAASLAAVLR